MGFFQFRFKQMAGKFNILSLQVGAYFSQNITKTGLLKIGRNDFAGVIRDFCP